MPGSKCVFDRLYRALTLLVQKADAMACVVRTTFALTLCVRMANALTLLVRTTFALTVSVCKKRAASGWQMP